MHAAQRQRDGGLADGHRHLRGDILAGVKAVSVVAAMRTHGPTLGVQVGQPPAEHLARRAEHAHVHVARGDEGGVVDGYDPTIGDDLDGIGAALRVQAAARWKREESHLVVSPAIYVAEAGVGGREDRAAVRESRDEL